MDYRASYILTVLTLALLTIGFTLRSDPYGLYTPLQGLEEQKRLDLFQHVRLYKPYAIDELRPRHIVTGNSTAGRLIPAEIFGGDEPSYNAAIPGGTWYELLRQVEHAQQLRSLETLVVGLMYGMFRVGQPDSRPGFEEARLLDGEPGQESRKFFQLCRDAWSSLFSRGALKDSILKRTGFLLSQRGFYADGSWDTNLETRRVNMIYSMISIQKYAEFSTLTMARNYRGFERLLDYAESNDIRVLLFITPFHAHIMNAIELAGQFEAFQQWQREVVAVAGRRGIPIFGLETNRSLILEPIGRDAVMYHDGVHYTRHVGRLIGACLRAVLTNLDCGGHIALIRLDAGNIEAYLAEVARIAGDYPRTNPEDYAKLRRQVEKTRKRLDAGERVLWR